MNSEDWREPTGRLRGNLEPARHCSMDAEPRGQGYWDSHCRDSYTHHHSRNMHLTSNELNPALNDFHIEDSGAEGPDGEPVEINAEDAELERKRRELREIEERIMSKKAAIAHRKTEPCLSSDQPSPTREGVGLKARVNAILLERQSVNFLSVIQSLRNGEKSSSLSKDGSPQKDHPLKLRVQPLMNHRCRDRHFEPINRMVPDVTPPSPVQRLSPLPKEVNNQGFQRFLSVLNKGVDMDFLSRIVNADGEDLPVDEDLLNAQSSVRENKSDLPLQSESPHSNSGGLFLGHRRSKSVEGKTDPPSQERSLSNDRLDDDKNKDDRGAHCQGSSSRSKSPLLRKEEKKPEVDEPHVQLQKILKTLGLNLEMDDMSKLTDRTQERLYGKKHEDVKTVCKGEEEGNQQSDSHRQDRVSPSHSSSFTSSSSSSSPSSRLTPKSHRRSHSRDQRQRRVSEGSKRQDGSKDRGRDGSKDRSKDGGRDGSRDRSRDRSRSRSRDRDRSRSRDGNRHRCRDRRRRRDRRMSESGNKASRETQRYRSRDEDRNETSAYMHPYPQNHPYQPYANHCPPASLAFRHCVSQYPQHSAFHSGTPNSYWQHAQGAIGRLPYPQSTYQQYHLPLFNPCPTKIDVPVHSDLFIPKSNTKRPFGNRCMTTIPTTNQCSKRAIKAKVEQPNVEKLPLTETEIKQNLKKKLDAFNQKAKLKLTQSATPLLSITGRLKSVEDQEYLELEPAVSTEGPHEPHV